MTDLVERVSNSLEESRGKSVRLGLSSEGVCVCVWMEGGGGAFSQKAVKVRVVRSEAQLGGGLNLDILGSEFKLGAKKRVTSIFSLFQSLAFGARSSTKFVPVEPSQILSLWSTVKPLQRWRNVRANVNPLWRILCRIYGERCIT